MTNVVLPDVMDKASLAPLAEVIAAAITNQGTLTLDGGQAGRVGLSGVQLLASAARTAREAKCAFSINNPSAELQAAIRIAGLEVNLGLSSATGVVV